MQANAQGGLAGAPGRTFERVTVVKALAGRKVPSAVAHAFSPGGVELVVVERYREGLDAASLDELEREARAMMSLRHPNVAAVRDVWRENGELCIATEYVEGETLEELRRVGAGGKELTIEIGVRVIVDVLGALSAIHTLGLAGAGGAAHGEVTASNVIVGFDGTTRIVRPFRGRIAGKVAEPDWFSYVAPEVVRGTPPDVRADLYAVGVLLWETLSRRKLFPKATREGRAARSMPVGKPAPPADASWAAPLGAVTERALANDAPARYTSAAEMAAAVRLAVRSKLAMPPRVSAAVDKLAGERILARRNANAVPDPASEIRTDAARISARPPRPSVPPEAVRALAAMRPSSRPPTPSPGPVAPIFVPKAPALPSMEPRTGPRPPAPPLKLADPTPKPPSIAPPPDELFEELALLEAGPAPPIAPPPPVAPPIAFAATPIATPAPQISPFVSSAPRKSGRAIWIAGAALIALFALAAVLRMTLGTAASAPPKGTATTAHTATPTATITPAGATTTAPSAVTTTTSTSTTTPTATATPSATADTSATPDPDPTSTTTAAPVDPSHRPHTRPRPTYDPMGI